MVILCLCDKSYFVCKMDVEFTPLAKSFVRRPVKHSGDYKCCCNPEDKRWSLTSEVEGTNSCI